MASDMIRGISVCNPVDLDPQYFMDTVIYAIEHNLSHIQFPYDYDNTLGTSNHCNVVMIISMQAVKRRLMRALKCICGITSWIFLMLLPKNTPKF